MSPTRKDSTERPKPVKALEPSSESQVDIAGRVQEDLIEVNERGKDKERRRPVDHKATQFDGSPNPEPDKSPYWFKPHDDTPAILPKRRGPKNPD